MLGLRDREAAYTKGLLKPRLERAIGVIYRPESELASHYFEAVLPWQFDEYVWFDETQAVAPLKTHEPLSLRPAYCVICRRSAHSCSSGGANASVGRTNETGRRHRDSAQLMSAFASRTGLYPASENQQRYLWTDAFAVCNFLELFELTGDELYRHCATHLIDHVHQVLGRYHAVDVRRGWISGLHEQAGQHYPTKGGLRIGKPLKERQRGEPIDERLE